MPSSTVWRYNIKQGFDFEEVAYPGFENFHLTYSSCGVSGLDFSLILTPAGLVLNLFAKVFYIVPLTSTFDIKDFDYLTFDISGFLEQMLKSE